MLKLHEMLKTQILWILFCITLSGCSGEVRYDVPEDLAGAKVGVLDAYAPYDSLLAVMPGAELNTYSKSVQLFLDVNAGICDAALVDSIMAVDVTGRNSDFVHIGNVCGSRYHVLVHVSRCASRGYYGIASVEWWKNWKERLDRGLFNGDAAGLLLKGFYTTVVIFIFAAIFAIMLAAFLTYMAIKHKWMWIYRPLSWLVSVLHDIPPVALMMFFYYVVFVSSGIGGIAVSVIALGIYTSGSLYKIFKIHITQIGKEQCESAFMLGMKESQIYCYVIFPQALKTAMPLLVGELKLLLRSTSYAGYIAQKDLVKAADTVLGNTFEAFVPLLVVSLIYLALSWAITELLHWLYKKLFVHG